jgi:hypothetical protein
MQNVPPWHLVGLELTWWLTLYWPHLSPFNPYQNLGTSPHFPFGIDLVVILNEV